MTDKKKLEKKEPEILEKKEPEISEDEIKNEMEKLRKECSGTWDSGVAKAHSSNPARVEKMYEKGTLGKCALPYLPLEQQREYLLAEREKLKAKE